MAKCSCTRGRFNPLYSVPAKTLVARFFKMVGSTTSPHCTQRQAAYISQSRIIRPLHLLHLVDCRLTKSCTYRANSAFWYSLSSSSSWVRLVTLVTPVAGAIGSPSYSGCTRQLSFLGHPIASRHDRILDSSLVRMPQINVPRRNLF